MNRLISLTICVALILTGSSYSDDNVIDPIDIVRKHMESEHAYGKADALWSLVRHGKLLFSYDKEWHKSSEWCLDWSKRRSILYFGPFKVIDGCNGKCSWESWGDSLTEATSYTNNNERLRDSVGFSFAVLNPESPYITLTYLGLDTANSHVCHIVRAESSLEEKVMTYYFDTVDYYERRTVEKEGIDIAVADYIRFQTCRSLYVSIQSRLSFSS